MLTESADVAVDALANGKDTEKQPAEADTPPAEANSSGVLIGLDSPDDAAVLSAPPPGLVTVHTVDFFRACIDDPYALGAVAANHALGDCHAMGAAPVAALAIAVVPYSAERIVEEDLFQMMAGASKVGARIGCRRWILTVACISLLR